MKKVSSGIIFAGTRPEIIKLADIYFCARENNLDLKFCFTGQQLQLGWQTLNCLKIAPEIVLDTMVGKQSLAQLSAKLFVSIEDVLLKHNPDYIIVQGDTTTVFCASVVAFYNKIDVFHVEAGLRTGSMRQPFPEEFNRTICSSVATYHFAVNKGSFDNLVASNIAPQNIEVVGNTVVDSLKRIILTDDLGNNFSKTNTFNPMADDEENPQILTEKSDDKFAIVTLHRRETINSGAIDDIAKALIETSRFLAKENFKFLFIKHPNPALENFYKTLAEQNSNQLFEFADPLNYNEFIAKLINCAFVITDSGGVCEEACVLGKSIVCVREISERKELENYKNYFLTGYNPEVIKNSISKAILAFKNKKVDLKNTPSEISVVHFGNGSAAKKIVNRIMKMYKNDNQSENIDQEIIPAKKTALLRNIVRVFGLGYVGLPTAILIANAGFYVIGIDTDQRKLDQILSGNVPFLPKELQERLADALKSGSLEVTTSSEVQSDFNIICVPTPLNQSSCDLKAALSVCSTIGLTLAKGSVVITESTISPGSSQELIKCIQDHSGLVYDKDFFFAYCPERVLPGSQMLFELENNPRIIGCSSDLVFEQVSKFYKTFCSGVLKKTSIETAEMVKLLENSSRNLAIAFANEVYEISVAAGLCPQEVIALANEHPRVKILSPGIGTGGHCIAIDPQFLIDTFPPQTTVLASGFQANLERPNVWIDRIYGLVEQLILKTSLKKKVSVLILGLSYKPDVPDLRESPALKIATTLVHKPKMELKVYEPNLTKEEISNLGFIPVETNELEKAISNSDLSVVLVAHRQLKNPSIINALQKSHTVDPVGLLCGLGCQEKIKDKPCHGFGLNL